MLFCIIGASSASGDDPPATKPDQVVIIVDPVSPALKGSNALVGGVGEEQTSNFDFHGELMDVVRNLDTSTNWATDSIHELEFANRSGGKFKPASVATHVLQNGDADAAMLIDFTVFVSPDRRQIRVVARLGMYTSRYGRYSAIEKFTRRYEYLSPAFDSASVELRGSVLTAAVESTGRMIRADLAFLLGGAISDGERRAFMGLDRSGIPKTYRGQALYVDGENTVYVTPNASIYSVPTEE